MSPDRVASSTTSTNTAGRFAPAGCYPAYSRSHNIWAHAWQISTPTATWTVDPPLEDLTPSDLDSEEEEESEADEPAALPTGLSHLRALLRRTARRQDD